MLRPDGAPACGQGPPAPEIQRFLQGPQPRGLELARAIRIFVEVLRGFRALHFVGPCVTVFGSARFAADHQIALRRFGLTYGLRARPRWYLGERA